MAQSRLLGNARVRLESVQSCLAYDDECHLAIGASDCQQAVEFATKALLAELGIKKHVHAISNLLELLPENIVKRLPSYDLMLLHSYKLT